MFDEYIKFREKELKEIIVKLLRITNVILLIDIIIGCIAREDGWLLFLLIINLLLLCARLGFSNETGTDQIKLCTETEEYYKNKKYFFTKSYQEYIEGYTNPNTKVGKKTFIMAITSLVLIISILSMCPLYRAEIRIRNNTTIWKHGKTYFDDNKDLYRSFDKDISPLYGNPKREYEDSSLDLEHIYCVSWAESSGVENSDKYVYDPLNVRLSLQYINNIRGNRYFNSVEKIDENKVYLDNKLIGYKTEDYFEPIYDKGDIGRAIIYMNVVYNLPYPYLDIMKEWAKERPQRDEIKHNKNVSREYRGHRNLIVNKHYLSKYVK